MIEHRLKGYSENHGVKGLGNEIFAIVDRQVDTLEEKFSRVFFMQFVIEYYFFFFPFFFYPFN